MNLKLIATTALVLATGAAQAQPDTRPAMTAGDNPIFTLAMFAGMPYLCKDFTIQQAATITNAMLFPRRVGVSAAELSVAGDLLVAATNVALSLLQAQPGACERRRAYATDAENLAYAQRYFYVPLPAPLGSQPKGAK